MFGYYAIAPPEPGSGRHNNNAARKRPLRPLTHRCSCKELVSFWSSFMEKTDSTKDIGAGFRQYFEIVPAVTDAWRDDVYSIRHEVYCEQLKYEPERADKRESDQYDAQSQHVLLRSCTAEKRLVGCGRVIFTRPDDPSAKLPFEITCDKVLDRSIVDPSKLPRETIAEVSRLAVSGMYRRRKGEQNESIPLNSEEARFPYIPMSLFLGTIAVGDRLGIEKLFLFTEKRLLEHFIKIGFVIKPIGDPIEHRGLRVPSMIDVKPLIQEMRSLIRPLYREIVLELDRVYDDQLALN
jgi:N-acyl amino acid synthase of PEP-CTERM/exosortase system